jgi:hypothetical protein
MMMPSARADVGRMKDEIRTKRVEMVSSTDLGFIRASKTIG